MAAVVAYHAFPRAMPGGFIGVDVFFVVSGYLISGILFRESMSGRVDLRGFYARRIRRIFPALTLVLFAVATMGWLTLTNLDYKHLLGHIGGGSIFVSNLLLWQESGYFDKPSELKPLLHLWSLGIEEQFYLIWPLLIWISVKRGLHAGWMAATIVAASFALNLTLMTSHPNANFYLPASRMWELLVGGLLAYFEVFQPAPIERWRSPRASDLAALGGLSLIAAASLLLQRNTPYPGWLALLPVLGTVLVVWAGDGAWLNRRALSLPPIVYVGLISYPLYLWHWPLLSFLKITEAGMPTTGLKVKAVVASFVLAAFTYHAIERPIRASVSPRTPLRLATVTAMLLGFGALSLIAGRTDLLTSRTPYLIAGVYSRTQSPRHDPACEARFPSGGEYCRQYSNDLPVTTVLLGDSHAEHYLEGVGAFLETRGETVVHLGQSGCAPLLDLERLTMGFDDYCQKPDNEAVRFVAARDDLRRVMLAFKWTVAVEGTGWDIDPVRFTLAGTDTPNDESIRVALERTIDLFLQHHKQVWLMLQVPELKFNIPECFQRPFSFAGTVRVPCAVPRNVVDRRQARYREIVREMQRKFPSIKVFDPVPFLCDAGWCSAIVNYELMYIDENHLSREGSAFFADKFSAADRSP